MPPSTIRCRKIDLVFPFAHRNVEIFYAVEAIGQVRQFVIVGGEKCSAAEYAGDVFGDRPGETQTIQRAGAAADFIEDHQASFGGVVENVRRLGHLHHEGGLPAMQFIARADAGEKAIAYADRGAFGRNVAAHLREQCDQAPPGG